MKLTSKKCLTALALIAGLAGTPAALSHLNPDAFAVSYRQSLFAILGANFGPMSSMIKGEIPWDDDRFKRFAADLAMASRLDFARGFPDGSQSGQTRAKPEIWDNKDDFAAKFTDLREEAKNLAEAANDGNKKTILAQFQKTGGACKACHDEYKSKDYLN